MRIIIDLDQVLREGKRMVRFRTRFYRNAGVEIYEIMKDGLNNSIQNAVIKEAGYA